MVEGLGEYNLEQTWASLYRRPAVAHGVCLCPLSTQLILSKKSVKILQFEKHGHYNSDQSKAEDIINLVYLFNGISTPYELFKVEIWFIYKCLITIEEKRGKGWV